MTNPVESPVVAEVTVSPIEQVVAQLGRQKRAVDGRDAAALEDIYTSDSELVIHRGGPDGTTEAARVRGRDEIIRFMVAGWERTSATWYPGSSIHQIGTHVAEPTGDGRIRCQSYASYLHLNAAGTAELRGYGTYDDIWALEDQQWRLARREMQVYGLQLSVENRPSGSTEA